MHGYEYVLESLEEFCENGTPVVFDDIEAFARWDSSNTPTRAVCDESLMSTTSNSHTRVVDDVAQLLPSTESRAHGAADDERRFFFRQHCPCIASMGWLIKVPRASFVVAGGEVKRSPWEHSQSWIEACCCPNSRPISSTTRTTTQCARQKETYAAEFFWK